MGIRSNEILWVGGIVIVSEVVWQFYKKFRDRWTKTVRKSTVSEADTNETKQKISEVMFFSRDSSLCRSHINSEEFCPKDHCPVQYLRRLINYVKQAEHSLDVCMYVLTTQSLSTELLNAHKRGIRVRVILDRYMACNEASQVSLFHRNGVALRLQYLDVLMHHKFVIVDNETLITGSMNWTMSGFFGNFDNIIVTNDQSLVKPYVDEFEQLWEIFRLPICPELEGHPEHLT